MDDFSFWWYIIAAVIYFLTRGKKKKPEQSRPGTDNNPPTSQRPKSFEELLKEITEGAQESEAPKQEPVVIKREEPTPVQQVEEESIRLEGERRSFADDESRRVYEESIKMAEGADLKFERDEHFQTPRLFKEPKAESASKSFADELRDGLDADEAKKAVIYAEIMNRRY